MTFPLTFSICNCIYKKINAIYVSTKICNIFVECRAILICPGENCLPKSGKTDDVIGFILFTFFDKVLFFFTCSMVILFVK